MEGVPGESIIKSYFFDNVLLTSIRSQVFQTKSSKWDYYLSCCLPGSVAHRKTEVRRSVAVVWITQESRGDTEKCADELVLADYITLR
jgi:hypothetical protein